MTETTPGPIVRPMQLIDLGQMDYRAAWPLQEQLHAEVLNGGEEKIIFVEHPPVITLGRRPGIGVHVLAGAEELSARGIEVIETDRGGDVTYHGPGQLVAYPIIRLVDHALSVSAYVHLLERIIIQTLADLGINCFADPGTIGVWTKISGSGSDSQSVPAKIAAIGVRIRRGITMHGLALNVSTDLSFFDLIIPCGLQNRRVTSVEQLLTTSPSLSPVDLMSLVKKKMAEQLFRAFESTRNADRPGAI